MEELIFTPASIVDLLSQIDELKDVNIGISETIDGLIQLQIGNSIYIIEDGDATDVTVDSTVIDTVEDVNLYAYEDLADSGDIDLDYSEPIESGIIKQVAKTLLVGGLVRLTAKILR